MRVGESLYEVWKREIGMQRPAAGVPRRKVMAQSTRLRELAAGYRPPPPGGMPHALERVRRSILDPASQAAEAERRPAARREELTRLVEAVGRELDALTCEAAPEHVAELLRRRDAFVFLLAKVLPPIEVPDMVSLNARVREAVEAEVERLRRWRDSLVAEHKRIKVEVEEHERRGRRRFRGVISNKTWPTCYRRCMRPKKI